MKGRISTMYARKFLDLLRNPAAVDKLEPEEVSRPEQVFKPLPGLPAPRRPRCSQG